MKQIKTSGSILVSLLMLMSVVPLTLAAAPVPQVVNLSQESVVLPPGVTMYRLAGDTASTPAGLTVLQVPVPLGGLDGSDWTNNGGNAQRNGMMTTTGPTTDDLLWSGAQKSIISWLPVTEGGRLFVVRQNGMPGATNDSLIVAMDLQTGEELWIATIPYHSGDWTTWIAGVNNGHVYASRSGNGASVEDNLYALDAGTGALLWTSTQLIDAGPYDGVVFASNGDPIVSSFMDIWRFNANTGSIVWHADRLGSVSGTCGGALYQNAFYIADASPGGNIIVRYDATTGERQYQTNTMPGFTIQNTPFVGPDGTVYLCRTQNNPSVDFFYAFTDTGSAFSEKWHIPSAWTCFSEYATSADGCVYVLIPGPRVAKVSAVNGSILAQTDVIVTDVPPAPHIAVDAAGTVFVSNGGFNNGAVHMYSSDLTPIWDTTVHNINIGGPALGQNGILLLSGTGTDFRAYHRPLPQLMINITGGFLRLHVSVTNIGSINETNLPWDIQVKGGVFHRVNISDAGVLASLSAGAVTSLAMAKVLFGFGKITVSVTVDSLTKDAEGFLFGPFISIS
jgi:hypothetical protein